MVNFADKPLLPYNTLNNMKLFHIFACCSVIGLFLDLMLSGCASHPADSDDIVVDFGNADFSRWENVMEIDTILPLGEPKDSLILSLANKCIFADGKILFSDYKDGNLYAFDSDGKFLYRAGQKGQGKGEYSRIRDIAISADSSLIEVLDGISIKRYSATDGKFVDEVSLPDIKMSRFYQFQPLENGKYLLFTPDEEYSIQLYTPGDGIRNLREKKGAQVITTRFVKTKEDIVVLPDYGQFTLDSFNGKELTQRCRLDFGGKTLPESQLPKDTEELQNVDMLPEYFKMVMNYIDSDSLVYMRCVGPEQTYYDIFLNKDSSKNYAGPSDRKNNIVTIGADGSKMLGLVYPEYVNTSSSIYPAVSRYVDAGHDNPLLIKYSINLWQ